MNPVTATAVRLRSKLRWEAFVRKEKLIANHGGKGLDILFSHHVGWEGRIAEGFANTPHRIRFDELQQADLDAFDLVVPLSVADVLFVDACGPLRTKTLLPMPDAELVRVCDDKLLLNRRLIDLGFGAHVPALLDDPKPPFILKRRTGENSDGCHLVLDDATQAKFAPQIASEEFFCQALAGGASEFATHAVMRNGKLVAELSVEYIASQPRFIKATEPFVADDLRSSPCRPLIEKMLATLGFEGLCCLNYKIEDGHMQLIEINPRFGGSLAPFFFAFVRRLQAAATAPALSDFLPAIDLNAAGSSPAGR